MLKTRIKKVFAGIMCACIAFGASAACRRGDKDDKPADLSKTQLTIGNVDGGYGDEWLDSAIKKFEEKYKDYSFEDGKRGIEIHQRTDHDYHGLVNLESSMKRGEKDMYISESVPYDSLIRKKLVEDITDAVEEPLSSFGEDASLADKMFAQYNAEVLRDGKYYAVPYNIGNYGIVYNVDLFEAENLYFGENGDFVKSKDENRGTGPDGEPSTYDDGLPRTYDELYKLCDKMLEKGITPFVWTGKFADYENQMLYGVATDVLGAQKMKDCYALDANLKIIASASDISDSGVTYTDVTITNRNGYKFFLNEGTYTGLTVMKKLVSSNYATESSYNKNYTHLDSEKDFLFGGYTIQNVTYPKIGMMVNGSWWYNEADSYFKMLVDNVGESAGRTARRFGMMPFPKTSLENLGKSSVKDSQKSMIMVSSKAGDAQKKAACEFIRFLHTDDMLKEYAALTDAEKPYKYVIDNDTAAKMTAYASNLHELYQASDIFVAAASQNPLYVSNDKYFNEMYMNKGMGSEFVVTAFKNKPNATVKDYADAMLKYRVESDYNRAFSDFLK